MNVFNDCKMADSQNRLLSVIQEGKEILENLKADGNCRIPEEDLTDLIHEVRRRRHKGLKCWFSVDYQYIFRFTTLPPLVLKTSRNYKS
jgi:hypothetical protein